MPRITKPVEERKREIIDTARELFTKNGFDKTQMTDITKKMNVAAGTVYHYFKSKTDILYAVIDELAQEKMEKKHQLLETAKGSAFDLLKLILTSVENDKEQEDLNSTFGDDPAIIKYYLSKRLNSSLPPFVSLIEQGNKDGSWNCSYPAETAVFILHGLEGVLSGEQGRKDSPQEKRKRIKAYINIVLRILGAEVTAKAD